MLLLRMTRLFAAAASRLEIPRHLVSTTFSRSSGSGGQNVNKVSTKVTLRLLLADAAPFLPTEVFARFREQQHHRISKNDELILQCDEERTQARNIKLAFERLQSFVDDAAYEPAEFLKRQDTALPARVKNARLQQKKQHSQKKSARRKGFGD